MNNANAPDTNLEALGVVLVRQQKDGAHSLYRDARADGLLAQRLQSREEIPASFFYSFILLYRPPQN